MNAFQKSYTLELSLPNTVALGQKINFPDIPLLKDKKIVSIEPNITDIQITCPSKAENISAANYAQSIITIQSAESKTQIANKQPVLRFNPFYYGGRNLVFTPQKWSFPECYIQFMTSFTAVGSNGQSMLFTVYYQDK